MDGDSHLAASIIALLFLSLHLLYPKLHCETSEVLGWVLFISEFLALNTFLCMDQMQTLVNTCRTYINNWMKEWIHTQINPQYTNLASSHLRHWVSFPTAVALSSVLVLEYIPLPSSELWLSKWSSNFLALIHESFWTSHR